MVTRTFGTGVAVAALCLTSACVQAVAVADDDVAVVAAGPAVVCATPELQERVAGFYSSNPATPTLIVSRVMGVSEEQVAAALSDEFAVSTTGAHYEAVWESIAQIPGDVMTIINANGSVVKIPGPAPRPNDMVEDDGWFDILPAEEGAPFIIHLAHDTVTSIYAVDLPGGAMDDGTVREGSTRAILFFADTHNSIVGVYATVVDDAEPDALAAFEATWGLIASLPPACS